MTEVRFYHLTTASLESALPQIIEKAFEKGHRIMIKTAEAAAMKPLDKALWTYKPDSFLPHGKDGDHFEETQPIWITTNDKNVNESDLLILIHGAEHDQIDEFKLCCEVFDGRDQDAVTKGREKWAAYKDKGYDLTYWQQNERGGWDKK